MRQCPDCEEKDRVVIAGKVFCANCGTPWETADQQEHNAYLEKVGLAETPKQSESAPAPVVAPQPPTPAPVSIQPPVQAGASQAPAPVSTPAATVAAVSTSSVQPAATPTQPPAPLATSNPLPVAQPEPSMPAVAPVPMAQPVAAAQPAPPVAQAPIPTPPQQSSVQPMSSAQPIVPASSPAQSTNQAPVTAPALTPAPQPAAPMAVTQPVPTAPAVQPEMAERVASEIPSLDSKEEGVLSDTQLQAMSQVSAPALAPNPSSAPVASPKSMVDIAPPAVASAPAPAAVANNVAVTQALPTSSTPQVTAQPAPQVAPVMSRDDALKLALGDAAPAVAQQPAAGGVARPMALVMSAMAFVLLGAYLWQSNYPSFALKLASVRSGVEAAAPGYLPNGWVVTRDVTSANGSLIYKLQNKEKAMTVAQQKTDWDSQALLEQYILPKSPDYLALQASGLTIYVFSNNQAAWVNHGIMYKIEGDHGLDQDQIIRIATSL